MCGATMIGAFRLNSLASWIASRTGRTIVHVTKPTLVVLVMWNQHGTYKTSRVRPSAASSLCRVGRY